MKSTSNKIPRAIAAGRRPFAIHAATNPLQTEASGPEGEPGQLHPKGKIESGFCLMIVRPPCSEGKIYYGGDQDPGDEPDNNGRDRFHGRGICGGMGKRAFHISLIVIL